MLICSECGALYDDWDVVPEYDGDDLFPKRNIECTECGSRFIDEAALCEECLGWRPNDNIPLCNDCLDKHMHDKDLAFQYGMEHRERIEINSFIVHLFHNDARKIEQVLKEIVEQRITITETDFDKFWQGKEKELCEEVLKND